MLDELKISKKPHIAVRAASGTLGPRVARQQFGLLAIEAAGIVEFGDRELDAAHLVLRLRRRRGG